MLLLKKYLFCAMCSMLTVGSLGATSKTPKTSSLLKMVARDVDDITEPSHTTLGSITEQNLLLEIRPNPLKKTTYEEKLSTQAETAYSTIDPTKVVTDNVETSTIRRKSIKYDQRQEGKFNIRADLENFMIILVPSKPSSQLSLLELLMKSATARNQEKNSHKKFKNQSGVHENLNLFEYPQYKQNSHLYQRVPQARSPYKVDIDSTLGNESQYMEMQSVPTTPFQFARQFPVLQLFEKKPNDYQSLGNYNRKYRSIDGSLYGFSDGKGENTKLEESLTNSDVFNSLNLDNIDDNNQNVSGGGFSGAGLKLLGATEQCGPDRLRDSYGVCQFVRS